MSDPIMKFEFNVAPLFTDDPCTAFALRGEFKGEEVSVIFTDEPLTKEVLGYYMVECINLLIEKAKMKNGQ
ncbi:MAG: hypothetical protein EOM19_04040 [Candidatus Moranbacteria bacterium]|nr:hypothetical protein [Candidatus Moranbacteria bacterium]